MKKGQLDFLDPWVQLEFLVPLVTPVLLDPLVPLEMGGHLEALDLMVAW